MVVYLFNIYHGSIFVHFISDIEKVWHNIKIKIKSKRHWSVTFTL